MSEPKKTESFAGNVMKYSIATYLGFGISGAALIIKGVLPAESYAVPASFMAYTMSLMNVGMLGLDQSLLRFYHEPPAGSTGRSMFAACTRLSVLVMLLVGGIGSIFFAKPLAAAFGLGANGAGLVPFLFLNAALYMLVRYLNVLLQAGKQCARLHHRNAVDAGLPEPDLPAARLCYPGRPRFCAGCGVQLCGGRSVLLAAGF